MDTRIAMPERIQMRRTAGWRKPAGTIYCGRPSLFGNPFPVSIHGREKAVELHRRWLRGSMPPDEMQSLSAADHLPDTISLVDLRRVVLDRLQELRGHDLACWCRLDQPCHADVLLELANADTTDGPETQDAAGPPSIGSIGSR